MLPFLLCPSFRVHKVRYPKGKAADRMEWLLFFGLFMGWSLGTNDAANAFGTAVGTKTLRYRTVTPVLAVFVLLGAAAAGTRNLNALTDLAAVNGVTAAVGSLAELHLHAAQKAALVYACAGLTVFLMSLLKLPVSANQSIVGAIIGWGLCRADYAQPQVLGAALAQLGRFAAAWLINPLAAGVIAYALVRLAGPFCDRLCRKKRWLQWGYLAAGAFASYGIGANSSAGVTALYYGPTGLLSDRRTAVLLGGAAIALGAVTYSRRVMDTVGGGITALTPADGFLVVLAMAAAVTGLGRCLGVPVSTSESIVGAVIGAGLTRGVGAVRFAVLRRIMLAWVCAPLTAAALTFVAATLTRNVLP